MNAAIRSSMIHRMIVKRDVNEGAGSFGGSMKPSYQFNGTFAVLAVPKDIKQVVDGNKLVVIPVLMILVAASWDIRESDRIESITDRKGVEIFAGPMKILSVGQKRLGYNTITARSLKAA